MIMMAELNIKMYNLIKDAIEANDPLDEMEVNYQMEKLINEIEEHRKSEVEE